MAETQIINGLEYLVVASGLKAYIQECGVSYRIGDYWERWRYQCQKCGQRGRHLRTRRQAREAAVKHLTTKH